MLIITTSSKTLDFESDYTPLVKPTTPAYLEKAETIRTQLRAYNPKQLESVMDVSEKIALQNFDRIQEWESATQRPALLAYKGDVFKPLHPQEYSKEQSEYAQSSLYIMSGLYGVLRAFDLMKPYRLEMRLSLEETGKVSTFWRQDVTAFLNEQIEKHGHKIALNVASKEYIAAVDEKELNVPMVHVDFKKRNEDGSLRTVVIYAKTARGMMMDYCIQNQVETIDQVKEFAEGGYAFAGEEDGRLLFVRK